MQFRQESLFLLRKKSEASMQFQVVEKGNDPIAVIFHDYAIPTFFCRTKSLMFQRAFGAACVANESYIRKEDSLVRVIAGGPTSLNWLTEISDRLCSGYWSPGDRGVVPEVDRSVDVIVRKFLI